jgi:hypothetical protein
MDVSLVEGILDLLETSNSITKLRIGMQYDSLPTCVTQQQAARR